MARFFSADTVVTAATPTTTAPTTTTPSGSSTATTSPTTKSTAAESSSTPVVVATSGGPLAFTGLGVDPRKTVGYGLVAIIAGLALIAFACGRRRVRRH